MRWLAGIWRDGHASPSPLAYIDNNSMLLRTCMNYGWTNTLLRGHASPSVQGVMMPGARRAVLGPYGGGLLPPQINDYANKADGLKPIRTVGVMMLGAKRAILAPAAGGVISPVSSVQSPPAGPSEGIDRQVSALSRIEPHPL